ncbi:serine/threonine-protein kinase [Streptantibioticus rubrisoli]|uniref:non-specific serine/threonine protein kinase n=1 Tax=Streptantibioticus rubrisoli TaxID=1387313 RepID=A0ABT1P587_9ACTN|nr:serine/threonine-protein kinase [Streptantibioticus rubrisoli]MCQ4040538.1 serine/threonine protein kinase [Streptantibioticus rubrisoli]
MATAGETGGDLTGALLGGRYRVTGEIGRGGMGVVCRARDEVLGREVAVKVLRTHTDATAPESADLRVRMQREARAAARVRHSGVITVHDVIEQDGRPVIVMELVDGPSLADVLAERGPMDPREAADTGAKVLDALDAAHQAGVLHRDVKPGNVLLERGGRVVLTDFGIASMEAPGDDAATTLTRGGELVGSLDYMAPERAQGQQPGPASDIWSLGMTLYAAVEGASPFRRSSVYSTLNAIVTEELPEPRRAGALTPVLRALMHKDPAARPSAAEAREMLQAVAAGTEPAVAQPEEPVTQRLASPDNGQPPQRRRGRALLAAAAAVAVLAAGGVAYALTSGGGGNDTAASQPTANEPSSGTTADGSTRPEQNAHRGRGEQPSGPHKPGHGKRDGHPAGGTGSATPPGSYKGDGPPPAPCRSADAGKYDCTTWRSAASYDQSGARVGTLHAGGNYFYCQADLGRRETSGRWTNTWWARTDDDSGHTNVYVSDVYLKGGENDKPVPGLPTC